MKDQVHFVVYLKSEYTSEQTLTITKFMDTFAVLAKAQLGVECKYIVRGKRYITGIALKD